MFESILIIPLSELAEVYGGVAERAVLELKLLDLGLVHLVLAALAAVVVPGGDGLAADHAGGEVAAAGPTDGVVLADGLLAVPARTLQALSRRLLRRVLGEDVDGDLHVSLSLLGVSHAFELHEGARTLLVALRKGGVTLL